MKRLSDKALISGGAGFRGARLVLQMLARDPIAKYQHGSHRTVAARALGLMCCGCHHMPVDCGKRMRGPGALLCAMLARIMGYSPFSHT